MIAICPACHDAVTRGDLRITDEDAYNWKRILRADQSNRGHLYVEPSDDPPKLLLGTVAAMGTAGLIVFSEATPRRLAFTINGVDIMGLQATISTVDGKRLARVVDGHLKAAADSKCRVTQRAGHIRVTHPLSPEVLPRRMVDEIRHTERDFAMFDSVTLLAGC